MMKNIFCGRVKQRQTSSKVRGENESKTERETQKSLGSRGQEPMGILRWCYVTYFEVELKRNWTGHKVKVKATASESVLGWRWGRGLSSWIQLKDLRIVWLQRSLIVVLWIHTSINIKLKPMSENCPVHDVTIWTLAYSRVKGSLFWSDHDSHLLR